MVHKELKGKRFSIFRSAGEEAEQRSEDARTRSGESDHMRCVSGRIVSTPSSGTPFTAVMTCNDGSTFEVAFGAMSDAEAFVRRNTPSPSERSTTYDHPSG